MSSNIITSTVHLLVHSVTDLDGRCSTLLSSEHILHVGTYRVHFDTNTYFNAQRVKGFYPYGDVSDPIEWYTQL